MRMLTVGDKNKQIERSRPVLPATEVAGTYADPGFDRSRNEPAGLHILMSFLWRRKRTIAASAICGLLAGIAIGLLSSRVYRARTSLQLEGFNDQRFREITLVSPLPASVEDYLQNEVKVLQSDTLARAVAKQFGGEIDAMNSDKLGLGSGMTKLWQAVFPRRDAKASDLDESRMRRVKQALTVHTGLQSQVIDVFFDASNPRLAAHGANAVASEFMNLNREAQGQLVKDTTEWLDQQAGTLRAKLQNLNTQLQDFTVSSGLILPGKEDPIQDRVRQLQDVLTRAEADRAAKQGRYENAALNGPDTATDPDTSGALKQYEMDLQNMRRQLADLQTIYTPDNYRVTRLQAQITETEGAIERERKQSIDRLRADYRSAASVERTLSESLQGQLANVQKQTEKELQYNVIRHELDATQTLYDSVLQRAAETGAASSARVTSIRVIDPATPPTAPYSPNLPLNMAIGLGLGTIAGLGLVLVRARSGKVNQPGELASIYVPELGVVPSAPRALALPPSAQAGAALVPTKLDSSLLRDSFRAILTSIFFSTPVENNGKYGSGRNASRILTVTSLVPMEGKTTIVTNLGIACALQKRDVLLIDADIRRPRLHERFGLPNTYGLTSLLERPIEQLEMSSPESLVQPTKIPHLWVLTSGPTDSAAVDLLYSSDVDSVLQHLARRFGLIFIDTPPVSVYSDARILARMSGGLVMVVRANTNTFEMLRATYQKLLQDGIHVLGTVLNDWKMEPDQARSYARYYGHYSEQSSAVV